jgi:hypothetical protein
MKTISDLFPDDTIMNAVDPGIFFTHTVLFTAIIGEMSEDKEYRWRFTGQLSFDGAKAFAENLIEHLNLLLANEDRYAYLKGLLSEDINIIDGSNLGMIETENERFELSRRLEIPMPRRNPFKIVRK